jgi:hypothetical protein
VLRAAGAIMTLHDLRMVCLQPCDQFLQIFCRDRRLSDNQDGTAYQQRDRFEVLHHIVLERVDCGIDDELIRRA